MTDIEIPEGFTRWDGGKCPVDPEAKVEIILRDGYRCFRLGHTARRLSWAHPAYHVQWPRIGSSDIIAYRIVSP